MPRLAACSRSVGVLALQLLHPLGQLGDHLLLLGVGAHQLLGGVGQALDGDGDPKTWVTKTWVREQYFLI